MLVSSVATTRVAMPNLVPASMRSIGRVWAGGAERRVSGRGVEVEVPARVPRTQNNRELVAAGQVKRLAQGGATHVRPSGSRPAAPRRGQRATTVGIHRKRVSRAPSKPTPGARPDGGAPPRIGAGPDRHGRLEEDRRLRSEPPPRDQPATAAGAECRGPARQQVRGFPLPGDIPQLKACFLDRTARAISRSASIVGGRRRVGVGSVRRPAAEVSAAACGRRCVIRTPPNTT